VAAFVEHDLAVGQREQGPVAPGADVAAGDEFGAALADDDAARRDELAAKTLHAQPFADAVAPVANTALTFLMCHNLSKFDFAYLDAGQFLPMPDRLMITFAAFHLEGQLLVSPKMFDHVPHHTGAGHDGSADRDFAVVVDEQHAAE